MERGGEVAFGKSRVYSNSNKPQSEAMCSGRVRLEAFAEGSWETSRSPTNILWASPCSTFTGSSLSHRHSRKKSMRANVHLSERHGCVSERIKTLMNATERGERVGVSNAARPPSNA
jgi:hypothetical protein